jgi:hypothetical protein
VTSRARLDADRTAKPRTILTAPIVSGRPGGGLRTMWPGPAAWLVDTETGERTALASEPAHLPAPTCWHGEPAWVQDAMEMGLSVQEVLRDLAPRRRPHAPSTAAAYVCGLAAAMARRP